VISKVTEHHTAEDFKEFLDEIDRQVDPVLTVHLICDNCPPTKPRPSSSGCSNIRASRSTSPRPTHRG
jgi:hypothetical protein